MLYQVVNTPTRDINILELFLTNNERLIRNVSAQDTPLSDHRVVSINLLTDLKSQSPPSPIPTFEDHTFRFLNIHKADFIKMNSMLSAIGWNLLRDQCHADPDGSLFVGLFRLTVLQVCCICSPKKLSDQKSVAPKSEHSRKRYVLNSKRRKLNSQLKALKDRNPLSPKIKKIEEEINLIHFNIKKAHCAEQNHQEIRAVAKVLVNPKFFFSYAKKHSSVKCSVGPLSKNGTLTNNPSEMAELLQEQLLENNYLIMMVLMQAQKSVTFPSHKLI